MGSRKRETNRSHACRLSKSRRLAKTVDVVSHSINARMSRAYTSLYTNQRGFLPSPDPILDRSPKHFLRRREQTGCLRRIQVRIGQPRGSRWRHVLAAKSGEATRFRLAVLV